MRVALYNRGVRLTLQVFALALMAAPPVGTPDAALTRLFTPRAVPAGTYVVYTSGEALEPLAARLRELDPSPAPGAWTPTRPEAHGAFGQEGLYDRARLARLFNGKRVTVVRGSLLATANASRTPWSPPTPMPRLSRIVDGTMVIEFRVPSLE